ncbi:hypothetical protein OSB04_019951 [Centaurea solstitialis]|uniref:Uncharacterized protein n=1 Tax=Centaurea solstitialis TaxID=347529 RepID=A0AA38SRT2_9ASTR|nr:hypothetical protein OSB04_019951 [Centaurea solstitialis]
MFGTSKNIFDRGKFKCEPHFGCEHEDKCRPLIKATFELMAHKMQELECNLGAIVCSVPRKNREEVMESLLGVSKPENIDAHNPKAIKNK